MRGEFDSAQRETTDAYRENWERIYGEMFYRHCSELASYPNGCPILDEDQRANQANGPAA